MNLRVSATPDAEAQIAAIDEWWRRNRPAAPDLFLDDLIASFELLANAPYVGRHYRRSPIRGVRRLLMKRSRYHVYYVPADSEVRVLAVWHAQRGSGPRFEVRSRG